jgi:glycosyltransferase involved in cell wall biosynthesis
MPNRRNMFAKILKDASFAVSVASRMEADTKRIFPHAKTVVVHNGSDPPPPGLAGAVRPSHLQKRTVIFCAGMFYERKGIPLLVKAFSVAFGGRKDVMLRIAGEGRDRRNIEKAIADEGLSESVTLLGLVNHSEVLQEMAWADAFALVGWNEPFATVYSEACAAGKPIVMCNDGGFNDVFRSTVHGFAVPPFDLQATAAALRALVDDSNMRSKMGGAAFRLWQERLSWDANASRMVELLADAAGVARIQK